MIEDVDDCKKDEAVAVTDAEADRFIVTCRGTRRMGNNC